MDFIKCYLCGDLAVQEHVTRDLTVTIFCTSKICGRYDIEYPALQALQSGSQLKLGEEEIRTRVYVANRQDDCIVITTNDLQQPSETTI